MNVELLPIAEKKIRQMGGEAMGVVVRRDDGILVAVTDSGRVTRLDDAVAGPVRDGAQGAEPVGFVQSEDMEQLRNGAPAKIYAPNNRPYGRYCFVYTHPQSAQQGGYPDCDTCGKPMDYMPWHYATETERHLHACNECWPKVNPANPAAKVPDEPTEAMFDAAMSERDRQYPANAKRYLAHVWGKMLAAAPATPQQSGEWVRCGDRLPTEDDADCSGEVWVFDLALGVAAEYYENVGNVPDYAYWMPTGLKRPNPPKQEGSGDE